MHILTISGTENYFTPNVHTHIHAVLCMKHVSCQQSDLQTNTFILMLVSRPVESHSGAQKTTTAGPYDNLIRMPQDRDAECIETEETWGGVSPHHLTRGLEECRKFPQQGPGHSPSQKWILCTFQVRKKPSGTPFSVFWAMAGPQTSWGPGKLPPSRWACL